MRSFLRSGSGIVALIFGILGLAFLTATGIVSTLPAPRALGIVFGCVGAGALTVSVVLGSLRLRTLRARERVLRDGAPTQATIVEMRENRSLRVNARSPWVIVYRYEAGGHTYEGRETLWDVPAGYKAGSSVAARYDRTAPERSALVAS
jgi:hypothetical protein